MVRASAASAVLSLPYERHTPRAFEASARLLRSRSAADAIGANVSRVCCAPMHFQSVSRAFFCGPSKSQRPAAGAKRGRRITFPRFQVTKLIASLWSAYVPPAKFSGRRTQNTDAFPAARGLVPEKQIQKFSGAARATCAFFRVTGGKPFLKLEKLPNRQHEPPYRRATVGSMCIRKMVLGQKFSVGRVKTQP